MADIALKEKRPGTLVSVEALVLREGDDVAVVVASAGVSAGAVLPGGVKALEAVARGHKVALRDIAKGETIKKFGHTIAVATAPIRAGAWVHQHNAAMPSASQMSGHEQVSHAVPGALAHLPATFMGYPRRSGLVGTRNYIVVSATVNCSATVVKAICRHFDTREIRERLAAKGIDGIAPITHGAGCAQAIGGANYNVLNRTIAGTVFHPNVVAALFVGLGCEGTTAESILSSARLSDLPQDIPIEHIGIQDSGGTASAIAAGIDAVERLIEGVPKFERVPVPVSALKIALNCGGSDAFSSITANPVLGIVSDMLVARGGTVVLAEIPECHGVEDLLRARAVSPEVVKRLDDTFAWWLRYAEQNACDLNNNLAPGNIAGGITTIVEKSLGAVAKAGSSPLTDVVDYSAPIRVPGAVLMNTPGFDPVSVTGLVAGGCNMVTFTTGRGSVYGSATAPTIKIATNSELFKRMSGDMDFDAGQVLRDGEMTRAAEALYKLIVEVASGKKTSSEALGIGWEEFVVWSVGETL
ncbi:MAG: altronate dehydratase family protein [Alphaproteobacteria bacterium]